MNRFSDLLRNAAAEVRHYREVSPEAQQFGIEWLESLAQRMDTASRLDNDAALESAIDSLNRAIVDSGPLGSAFAPSFHQVADAVYRRRRNAQRNKTSK